MNEVYHIPAMLQETIEGLAIKPQGVYVDVTFGGGGHSRAMMECLQDGGHLYSFDQDKDALQNAIDDPKWTFVHTEKDGGGMGATISDICATGWTITVWNI